jgi:gliding motility-associated protein GldM
LSAQIDRAINGSKVHDDDKEAIKKIYASLTKQERSEVLEIKNVHWIGKTFDHSPSVAALASLSSMQKEILTARADAISLLRMRVGAGEFTFNSIMSLAYGPEVINQGEEAEIEVLMAAYDSDRTPTIMLEGKQLPADQVSNGKGRIKVKGSGSEMSLSGSITIVNKSGIPKTLPWEKKIRVMQPSGTVSLPKMNVLYRNYPNFIQGVASGYEETILQGGNGLQLRKEGDHYVGQISSTGREASVTISGRNKSTGKSQQLGVYKFRVMNLPKPSLFLGTFSNGQSVSAADVKAARNLFSKYPSDILLDATFTTGNWEIELSGNPRKATGTGKVLSQAAIDLLKQVKPGSTVTITGKFSGPASGFAACVIKVI